MVKSNMEQKAVARQDSKSVNTSKFKSLGTGAYLIVAVLVLAILMMGITVYKKLPQVTDRTIQEVGLVYYKNIEGLDTELTAKYEECLKSKNSEEWKRFSELWIPRIGEGKPEQFLKRLTKKSSRIVNDVDFLSRELFQIWTVYNASMENLEPAKDIEVQQLQKSINGYKSSIQNQLK